MHEFAVLADRSCIVLFPSKGQQPATDMCRSLLVIMQWTLITHEQLGRGGGVLPYMDYTGICHPIGSTFSTKIHKQGMGF